MLAGRWHVARVNHLWASVAWLCKGPTTPKGTTVAPVHLVLIIIHGIGLLLALVGLGLQIPRLRSGSAAVTWLSLGGASLLVLSGLGLATNIALTGTPNWPKLAIKFIIALAIAGGLYFHRGKALRAGMVFGMIGLVLVNTAIAIAW